MADSKLHRCTVLREREAPSRSNHQPSMPVCVQLDNVLAPLSEVRYRWDKDTDILSARVTPQASGAGMSGSVGVEGKDGSWLTLDVATGQIHGVEIAIWPDVRRFDGFATPSRIDDARVTLPVRLAQTGVASLEVNTRMSAEADPASRNFHFRFGRPRPARTVRLARDLLLDVDDASHITGLWLLNVPPCPVES